MPRESELREMDVRPGFRACAVEERQTAAGDLSLAVEAPSASGYRGHPFWSYLVHVERGNAVRVLSGPLGSSGRPTVRRAEFFGGNRMPKKRMPAAERQQESETTPDWPLRRSDSYNWLDTGPSARARKCADVWQVSL
jgi:hypothetical protein